MTQRTRQAWEVATASEKGAAIQQARQLVGREFEYAEEVVELAAALHVTRAPRVRQALNQVA